MKFWSKRKASKKIESFYKRKRPVRYRGQQMLEKIPNLMPAKKIKIEKHKISARKVTQIFWLFMAIALIYFLFSSPYFRIKNIATVGNRVILSSEIEKEIGSEVVNKNIFLINSAKIKSKLIEKFPRIESLTVTRRFPGAIKINIAERPSTIVWKTGHGSFLLDPKGYVIEEAKEDLRMPVVTDLANVPIKIGQQIVTPEFIDFVNQLSSKLPKKTGFGITAINIAETTFELQVMTDRKIYFLFDTTRDLDTQLEYLVQLLQDSVGKVKQYVDLRVETRIFYK